MQEDAGSKGDVFFQITTTGRINHISTNGQGRKFHMRIRRLRSLIVRMDNNQSVQGCHIDEVMPLRVMDTVPIKLGSRQTIGLRIVAECHRLDIQPGHSIIRSQPQVPLSVFRHADNCIIRQPVARRIVSEHKVIILVARQLIQAASVTSQPDGSVFVFQNTVDLFQLSGLRIIQFIFEVLIVKTFIRLGKRSKVYDKDTLCSTYPEAFLTVNQ